MSKTDLLIKSAYISSRNCLEDKDLLCGKIEKRMSPDVFLFYLIEVSSIQNKTEKVSTKIYSTINNFFKYKENVCTDDFENILISVNQGLSQLTKSGQNKWIGKLNAILGFSCKGEISISTTGSIKGYIFRKGKISTITESSPNLENHPLKTFTDITSGRFAKDDLLIFGNKDLFDFISFDKLKSLTKENSLYKETHDLVKFLKKINSRNANAIIIKTTDSTDQEPSPENGIFYIDDPEETVITDTIKKLSPTIKIVHLILKKIAKRGFIISKKIFAKSKKEFNEKIAPKTINLLNKSSDTLKAAAQKSKDSFGPQLEKLKAKEEFKKIKIKTFSHHSENNSLKLLDGILPYIYNLRHIFKKENRKYLYAAAIVIFLIIGYAKIKANNDKKTASIKQMETSTFLDKATEKYNKTREDIALGKTTSLEGYLEALSLAHQAKDSNNNGALKLIKEINSVVDEKSKIVRFYNAAPIILSDKIQKIVLSGTEIYGFEPDGKFYTVDTRDKEPKLISSIGQEFGMPGQIYYSASMEKIIVGTNKKKVLAFDKDSKSFSELSLSDPTFTWEEPTSIASYSTNIYLLDPINGQIWKHVSNDNMYSKGTAYVDTKKVSLKNSIDMSIDGNLFVLFNDGTVKKFVRGSTEPDFTLKGMPEPNNKIEIPAKIFTDENTNSIFILDKKFNRIVKFDKSGDFINQYVFDSLSIDDFVVNAKLQKIWAISGGKIYEGNL